jgi:hypothetical protein
MKVDNYSFRLLNLARGSGVFVLLVMPKRMESELFYVRKCMWI